MKRLIRYIVMIALLCLMVGGAVIAYLSNRDVEYKVGNNTALQELVDATLRKDSVRIAAIDHQMEQIAYYLRTHSVAEEGYDIVARYDQCLRDERDSLCRKDSILGDPWAKERLLHLISSEMPKVAYSENDTLYVKLGEWYAARPHMELRDTLPYYIGNKDVIGQRSGFGIDFTPGQRLRVGEWRNGKYRGEGMTYTDERIYGIDISRHQHEKGRKRYSIDWKRLAITSLGTFTHKNIIGEVNYPVSFIFIKSTEGTSVLNRYYAADYASAHKYGFKTGTYHFFSTTSSGKAQAVFFCKRSKYQRGDFPPVLDIEPSDAQIKKMGGAEKMFKEIRAWIRHVENTWHVKPILYINQRFVNVYLPYAPDIMHNYDVWIARYGQYRPEVNLLFWQLSPDGRVSGIIPEVDINVFNGFKAEFDEFCK